MSSWILVVVSSPFFLIPNSTHTQEFSSKEACDAALALAKETWSTINHASKCVNTSVQLKINELEKQIDADQSEIYRLKSEGK